MDEKRKAEERMGFSRNCSTIENKSVPVDLALVKKEN
jgi:hypothetical protein